MKINRSFSNTRLKQLLVGVVLLSACAFEGLPVLSQEYGGNLTPAPPRPRRAYSTIDTYNYTHGGGDTTYSDSFKKARRVKKLRKVIKAKTDGTTSKVTTSPGDTARSKNGTDSDSSVKDDADVSEVSVGKPNSEKVDSGKSARSKAPDLSSDDDSDSSKAAAADDSKVTETTSKAEDSGVSSATSATDDSEKNSVSDRPSGARLSSIPPPQMPPPPTSIGGLKMKSSSGE